MVGYEPWDSTSENMPAEDFTRDLTKGVKGLKIGVPRAWFADKLECNGRTYTFYWSASQQTARKTGLLNGVFIRFKWLEEEDPKAFFEFRINVDELTNNVILEITDYAESDEKEDCVELWNKQVATLKRRLGS